MDFISRDGKIIERESVCIRPDDHSYRYGDGLFETMRVIYGRILWADLHFDRLFSGLKTLQVPVPALFSVPELENEITSLCKKNKCWDTARVRLSVSGGCGGLYDGDEKLQYIIECWPLPHILSELNENGLSIDIFPDARKSCDLFSNLKSANHLPYAMAARFARQNKLNDCLVLNHYGRVCDSTIANIFWIKEGNIHTPPLSEGCIAGVTRRWLIEKLKVAKYHFQEKICQVADLDHADEIFTTNAIQGMRWVREFRTRTYANTITREIYFRLFS